MMALRGVESNAPGGCGESVPCTKTGGLGDVPGPRRTERVAQVTGHRGYIGVEMVPALLAAGHEVVGLDTGYYDECDFVSPPDHIPGW